MSESAEPKEPDAPPLPDRLREADRKHQAFLARRREHARLDAAIGPPLVPRDEGDDGLSEMINALAHLEAARREEPARQPVPPPSGGSERPLGIAMKRSQAALRFQEALGWKEKEFTPKILDRYLREAKTGDAFWEVQETRDAKGRLYSGPVDRLTAKMRAWTESAEAEKAKILAHLASQQDRVNAGAAEVRAARGSQPAQPPAASTDDPPESA